MQRIPVSLNIGCSKSRPPPSNVTIRLGFSGTVPIFNDMSRKKSQFTRDTHLSRFWLGVPDLSRFAHLCSRMLTHRCLKISSDFICIYDKVDGGRGSAPDSSRRSPRPSKLDSGGSRLWRSHPTIRAFGARPGLQCPNYSHPTPEWPPVSLHRPHATLSLLFVWTSYQEVRQKARL